MKQINEMTIKELEKEHEQNKSTAQKLNDKEIRALNINFELLKRIKAKIEQKNPK